jgi:hypothetical protein
MGSERYKWPQLEELAQLLERPHNWLNTRAVLGVLRMFEGTLLGPILFVVGYGPEADVLHGEFIQSQASSRARECIHCSR